MSKKNWIITLGILFLLTSIVFNVWLFINNHRLNQKYSESYEYTQEVWKSNDEQAAAKMKCLDSLDTSDEELKTCKNELSSSFAPDYIGFRWPNGFTITEIIERFGGIKAIKAEGSVKVTGRYFTYPKEGDCAYSCGETCFIADQPLPFRQEFCFSEFLDSNIINKLGKGEGRAEMIVKELSVPYEGNMSAKVEDVKILK